MSITLQRESFESLIPELPPLIEAQYNELTLHKEVVKLDPDWDRYVAMEKAGALVCFTARDNGRLVAYNFFFVTHHLHYRSLAVAMNDVIYIHDDYRRGPLALRLIRYTEAALKGLGAQKVAYHCKYGNHLAAILRRLEYTDEEAVVGKII